MKPWVLISRPVLKDSLKFESVTVIWRELLIIKDGPFVLRKVTLFKVIVEDESIEANGAQVTP